MKKTFPKKIKTILGFCFLVFIAVLTYLYISKIYTEKIEDEIANMISGEVFYSESDYDKITDKLNIYTKKHISKASLGTVYNRLAYQCQQEGNWIGYYSNFGKAAYYLEVSGNYNDEINLYCDMVFHVYLANGDLAIAEATMDKIDELVKQCPIINNQTKSLVSQRHALLAYYQGKYSYALQEAENSQNIVKHYNAIYSQSYYDAAEMIIAKINVRNMNFELAEQIVEAQKNSSGFVYGDKIPMINTNFIIPYYQLLAYVSASKGNETQLRTCMEEIFIRARDYDYEYAVFDSIETLRKCFSLSENFNDWLAYKELLYYKNFIEEKGLFYTAICTDLINTNYNESVSKEIEKTNSLRLLRIIFALIIFVILLVFVFFILQKRIYKDSLTGVKNRRAFDHAIKINTNKRTKYSVIMIDIDDFKKINDTYGHAEGDLVLRRIGSIILERSEDRKIIPYRYGGEEFAILIYDNYVSKGRDIAESLRHQIESQKWESGYKITISAGYARSVEKADKNLYKAKNNGKNQVV